MGSRVGLQQPSVVAVSWSLACVATPAVVAQIVPFTEEAVARGVSYELPTLPTGHFGYGIGLVDLDFDADLDLVVMGRADGVIGIFENDGRGFFTDRSSATAIPPIPNGSNFGVADWDDDGDLDLVISVWAAAPRLYRNDGRFMFTDVSAASGVTKPALTKGMAWGDVDGDGWTDLLIPHMGLGQGGAFGATRHQLWRNRGDGTFENVAGTLGIEVTSLGFMGALFDPDEDGDLDLYLSNDRGMNPPPYHPNLFWRNDAGVMNEIGAANGTGLGFFSMGIAIGDLDRNGRLDLYCTNSPGAIPPLFGANPLFLQQEDGLFEQAQSEWGAAHDELSWACIFLDVDNDGHLDLYVVDEWSSPNLLVNTGAPPFVDLTEAANLVESATPMFGAAVGDVDGDGDIDLVANPFGANVRVCINHCPPTAHWAHFHVIGEAHDRMAAGATVRVTIGRVTLVRQVLVGSNGYLGQSQIDPHVGLGAATIMDQITVRWPNSTSVRSLSGYAADRRWTLYPPLRMGDFDLDAIVTQADVSALAQHLGESVEPGLEMLDLDGNALLDAADFADLVRRMAGPLGDLDGDGAVGGADLAAVLGAWLEGPSAADLTGDGLVDGADIAVILGHWG